MATKLRIIIIDADVVSHFITAGEQNSLNAIFPNPIYLLDKVHKEATYLPTRAIVVNDLIAKKIVQLMPFPEENEEIKQEYFYIKKTLDKGDGESACLAVARFDRHIIASSNLRDIGKYCSFHDIDYLTTMDFLCYAYTNGIWTEERCDLFISKVKAKKGKLPCSSMSDYDKCRAIHFLNVQSESPEVKDGAEDGTCASG